MKRGRLATHLQPLAATRRSYTPAPGQPHRTDIFKPGGLQSPNPGFAGTDETGERGARESVRCSRSDRREDHWHSTALREKFGPYAPGHSLELQRHQRGRHHHHHPARNLRHGQAQPTPLPPRRQPRCTRTVRCRCAVSWRQLQSRSLASTACVAHPRDSREMQPRRATGQVEHRVPAARRRPTRPRAAPGTHRRYQRRSTPQRSDDQVFTRPVIPRGMDSRSPRAPVSADGLASARAVRHRGRDRTIGAFRLAVAARPGWE